MFCVYVRKSNTTISWQSIFRNVGYYGLMRTTFVLCAHAPYVGAVVRTHLLTSVFRANGSCFFPFISVVNN